MTTGMPVPIPVIPFACGQGNAFIANVQWQNYSVGLVSFDFTGQGVAPTRMEYVEGVIVDNSNCQATMLLTSPNTSFNIARTPPGFFQTFPCVAGQLPIFTLQRSPYPIGPWTDSTIVTFTSWEVEASFIQNAASPVENGVKSMTTGSVTAGTPQVVFASGTAQVFWYIQNTSATATLAVWVNNGSQSAALADSIQLAPGASLSSFVFGPSLIQGAMVVNSESGTATYVAWWT